MPQSWIQVEVFYIARPFCIDTLTVIMVFSLRIGFITYEYFTAISKGNGISTTTAHGGFGFLTMKKCETLASMGHEVHVFMPAPAFDKDKNLSQTLEINHVNLHLFKTTDFYQNSGLSRIFSQSMEYIKGIRDLTVLLREYPVDIYQTEEPYIYTLQALKISGNHLLIFQDPLDKVDIEKMNSALNDYLGIYANNEEADSMYIKSRRYLGKFGSKINGTFVQKAVKKTLNQLNSDRIFAEAQFISSKVSRMYRLPYIPKFLPNPIDFHELPTKDPHPSVVWLNRWDPVKQPQIALEIARRLPEIDFYFIGKATGYPLYDNIEQLLRRKYERFRNIKLKQFISEEEKKELLSRSWLLLNTSAREGLPVTFLEAGAHGMSIISSVNPDNYTNMFGGTFNNIDEAVKCIKKAVTEEWHRSKGKIAYNYIKKIHETRKVMSDHVKIYNDLLS